jgi:hypothetical protein
VTRRRWLRQLVVGIWTVRGAAGWVTARLVEGAWLVPSMVRASEPPMLSAAEVDVLVAFAEVLADGQPLGADERRDLAASLQHASQADPDRRAAHRTTVQVLARRAGATFADLDFDGRVALVRRYGLDVRRQPAGAPADAEDVEAVRTRSIPNLIAAYWASAAGWTALGYQAFPGRCGDLTRYTRPGP